MVIFCCLVGVGVGTIGVSHIITLSLPTFYLLYPISIVLTLLGVFKKYVPNHGAWKGAIIAASLIGFYDAVSMLNNFGFSFHIPAIENLYSKLPLASQGLAWVLPAIVGFIIGAVIVKAGGKTGYPMFEEK